MNEQESAGKYNPIIAISICVAVFLSLVAFLYSSFSFIGTDGVSYALLAKNLATGHGFTLFGYPHTYFSPLTPIAIVPFYWVFGDIELAASVAMITFEMLTLVVFYFVARRFADDRVATIATFFLAVSGPFVWSILHVMAQPLASLLTVSLLYCLLQYASTVKKGNTPFVFALCLGVLSGALYLNRPEYFFLPIPLVLFLAWLNWKYAPIRRNIALILLSIAGFLLLAVPYIIYLHHVLGDWTPSGRVGLVYLQNADLSFTHTSIVTATQFSENPTVLLFKQVFSSSFLKNYLENLYLMESLLLRAFGIIGFVFFGVGLRHLILQRSPEKLFVLAVPAFILLVLPIGHTGGGYTTPYFALFLLIIAVGCAQFALNLSQTFAWGRKATHAFLAGMVCISALYFSFVIFQNYFFRQEGTTKPIEYQMLGKWFQAHVPGHEQMIIAARKPEIAFYADANWRYISGDDGADPEGLAALLRKDGVAYIAIDTRALVDQAGYFVDERGYYRDGAGIPPLDMEEYYGNTVSLFRLAP